MLKFDVDAEVYDLRVVGADALHEIEGRGWHLIAIVQEQTNAALGTKRCPNSDNGAEYCPIHNTSYCRTEVPADPVPILVTKYVVARDRESALGTAAENLAELESRCGDETRARRKAETVLAEIRGELKDADARVDDLTKQLAESVTARATLEERHLAALEASQKLEADIGKLRQEFGEAAVRKVLG